MALKTCAVSVTVNAPDGTPVTNAIIVAELSERIMQEGVLVPERIVQRTDSNGQATLNLWPNAALDSPKTWYTVIISTPQGTVETFYISVPDVPTANMNTLERIQVPDGQEKEVARMLATLAQIQAETKGDAAKAVAALQQMDQKLADFSATIKEPDYWEGNFIANQARYPIAGATISEPKLYDVVANGIPQRPTIDYKIHIDESDANNSEIEFIGELPTGRNWWALTRTIITKPKT